MQLSICGIYIYFVSPGYFYYLPVRELFGFSTKLLYIWKIIAVHMFSFLCLSYF